MSSIVIGNVLKEEVINFNSKNEQPQQKNDQKVHINLNQI